MRILFLHPDLGIGGAERLILDAALGLQKRGHHITFYTNHYDRQHCFQETLNDSLQIYTIGSWIPRSVLGRFKALCAYLRFVYLALYLVFFVLPLSEVDIIFCDLISLCIPFLKLSSKKFQVIYYCHYPDKLLSIRRGFLKQLYRIPLDWMEEKSTAKADVILVNSEFTAKVFKQAFKSIKIVPEICYPSINTNFFEKIIPEPINEILNVTSDSILILSINRYERKKDLDLAIKSIDRLKNLIQPDLWNKIHLIVAGGYDPINIENLEHFEELNTLASNLLLSGKITFLKSPSDNDKVSLLKYCHIVIYTPSNEHFGIVPLEAMFFEKPVVAVNSGGPMETIVHNITGLLSAPNEDEFAENIKKLLLNHDLRRKLGEAGKQRFIARFSYEAFTEQLDNILKINYKTRLEAKKRK